MLWVCTAAVNDAVVDPVTNKVYVGDANSLRVVDGTSLAATQILNVPSASSIAVNPTMNVVYVSNGFSNITVINGATDTRITAFTLPTNGGPGIGGEGRLVIHNASGRVFSALMAGHKAADLWCSTETRRIRRPATTRSIPF